MRNTATFALWEAWLTGLYIVAFSAVMETSAAEPTRDLGPVLLTEAELAWEKQHPVVYYGLDPQWPPFSWVTDQGEIAGIDADMVNLLAKRTGLNMQLVRTTSWSETLRKATTGEIDFIGGIARTEQRKTVLGLRFTEIFCDFPTAIVTRMDTPFLTSMETLESRRVALPRNYATTEEFLKMYPNARVVLTENEEESMLFVSGNEADATMVNIASAGYIVHSKGLSNLKISGFSDLNFHLSVGVRPGGPELLSILQKGLASISLREKERIYAGYITPAIRNEIHWKTWRRRAMYTAMIGAGLLVAVLLWNLVLAQEIRRRKVVETELVQARDRLDVHARKLARHGAETQALNEQLTWANKDLEAFSSSVSHDLKSPLRRIGIFAELIELDAGRHLDEATRRHLTAIQRETQRMGELVEALLKFARVGRAQLQVVPVKLEELVRETIEEFKTETPEREILWDVHPLPEVVACDRGLIKQVLANLISNAVKFTRQRTPARIEIGVLPQQPGNAEVVVCVKDNGAGFAKEHAQSLFEGFRRLHRQEEFEGIGLGLANVKRIVQRHGGRVWAEGEKDKGATFYFSIPNKRSQLRTGEEK
jgi:signal transduction histidine kinase